MSRYLTNKLIGRNPLPQQQPKPPFTMGRRTFPGPSGIIHRFQWLFRSEGYVGYVLLTLSPLYLSEDVRARLACLIHAASVRSEPGSNPSVEFVLVFLCLGVGATVLADQRARPTSQGLSEITLIFKERQACLPGPRPWLGPRVQCSAPRLGGGMIGIGAHPSTPCLKNRRRRRAGEPKP